MRPFLILSVLFLTACGGSNAVPVPPSKLALPSDELMERPVALKDMKPGDSIYDDDALCRAEYGRVATKVIGLQNYASVITKRKPKEVPSQ